MKELIVTDRDVLRQVSVPITPEDNVNEIVERLKEANATAWVEGCGLAGIQIGIAKRIAWCSVEGWEDLVLINPEIVKTEGTSIQAEGCLSIPGKHNTIVERAERIFFTTESRPGKVLEAEGFSARVIQHEIDHMNGILNIDKEYKFPEKIGRNDPCPCNSGKKYKKCCLNKDYTLTETRKNSD